MNISSFGVCLVWVAVSVVDTAVGVSNYARGHSDIAAFAFSLGAFCMLRAGIQLGECS